MNKVLNYLFFSALMLGPNAWAQDVIPDEIGGTSERPISEITRGVFDSPLNVSARVGAFGFKDSNSNYTSRILEGVTVNWNLNQTAAGYSNTTVGLESGLLFTHNGAAGSNFIGTNAPTSLGSGSNSFVIPINLVLGYKPTDNTHLAASVGASAIYRSLSSSMLFGRASDTNGSSSTEFFPNVGVNLGWEVSKSFGISVRGDVIPTPETALFTATLGATFPLA